VISSGGKYLRTLLILICVLFLVFSGDALSHSVPVDQIGHHIQLVIFKDRVIVDYTIVLSDLAYSEALISMNIDRQEGISQSEKELYHSEKRKLLLKNLQLTIDGMDVALGNIDEIVDDATPQLFSYKFQTDIPEGSQTGHEVSIYNNIKFDKKKEMLEYYLAADVGIKIKDTKRFERIKDDIERGASVVYVVGDADLASSPLATVQKLSGNKKIEKKKERLKSLITEPNLSWQFVIIGLIVAAFLGGLHALAPGHGKAVVAAYLVGTRGRIRDAIFLGLVVTLTHVSSVIILGLIMLYASQYILPQQIYPILGLISGQIIVILGTWLLIRRLQQYGHSHEHGHTHSIFGGHTHDNHHGEHNHVHDNHEEEHIILVSEEHDETEDTHAFVKNGVTLWGLLTLGISGGIIPCPDALVVLLIAVAYNRIAFGLAIIGAFSAGLAAILVSIGILIVVAKPIIDRFTGTGKWTQRLPIISAVVIIALGFAIAFKSLIDTGILE